MKIGELTVSAILVLVFMVLFNLLSRAISLNLWLPLSFIPGIVLDFNVGLFLSSIFFSFFGLFICWRFLIRKLYSKNRAGEVVLAVIVSFLYLLYWFAYGYLFYFQSMISVSFQYLAINGLIENLLVPLTGLLIGFVVAGLILQSMGSPISPIPPQYFPQPQYVPQPQQPQQVNSVVICPKCYNRINAENNFCPQCGGDIRPRTTQ
jgi:hypothetical protein